MPDLVCQNHRQPLSCQPLSSIMLLSVCVLIDHLGHWMQRSQAVQAQLCRVVCTLMVGHRRTQKRPRTEKSGTTPCLESGTFAGACQHKAGKGVAAAGDRSLNCQHSSVSVIWPSVHTGYRRRAEAAEAAFARTQLSGIPVTNSAV